MPIPGGFAALGLSPPLQQALQAAGYEAPSPLQSVCIPALLAGRDLFAQAVPGSGTTLSFVLPLLDRVAPAQREPQYLVVTPSYAKSVAVAQQFVALAHHLPEFHVLPLHGGDGQRVQLRQLERGAHVVIGSPRWMLAHLDNARLQLDHLHTVVLDEADELLRMGFHEDLCCLAARLPASCQMALFAAGSTRLLEQLGAHALHDPLRVSLPNLPVPLPALRQRFWQVDSGRKLGALLRLIEIEPKFDAGLVFVHTRNAAEAVAEQLAARGYAAQAVHGDSTAAALRNALDVLRGGTIDVLVVTDSALGSEPLERVTHLIHYDLPCDAAAYGARLRHAPAAGHSLLLLTAAEKPLLHAIEHGIGSAIEPLILPERPRER